ncbi:MAG: hypothetical protein FJZ56_05245 [Chlamydiae bacterium]|nr:hypothetical protein [Chlamydiota bacterium]
MDKKTTTLLAVGVLAAVGFLVWKQTQKPKSFANLMVMSDEASGLDMCLKAKKCGSKEGPNNTPGCLCCRGHRAKGTQQMGCETSNF